MIENKGFFRIEPPGPTGSAPLACLPTGKHLSPVPTQVDG